MDQENSTARTESPASDLISPDGWPHSQEELRAATTLREAILYLYRGIAELTMSPRDVWREMLQVLRDTSVIEWPFVRIVVTKRDTPFPKSGPEPERLEIGGDFGAAIKKAFAAGKPPKNIGRTRE